MRIDTTQTIDPPLTVADRFHELRHAQQILARARLGLYPGMQAGQRGLEAVRAEAAHRGGGPLLLHAIDACRLLSCGRMPGVPNCITAVLELQDAVTSGDFAVPEADARAA